MARRSKDRIIIDILVACQKPGMAKTHLVHQSNLNFKTVAPYMNLLTRKGLLAAVPGKTVIYITTPNGRRALKALRSIEEMMPERLD
jgi:predicted transcriptional regulator